MSFTSCTTAYWVIIQASWLWHKSERTYFSWNTITGIVKVWKPCKVKSIQTSRSASLYHSPLELTTIGEQGWRTGESARLSPMCARFDSRTRRHMWTEFVGSLLCSERFFSGYSGFPLSSKTNIWFDLIDLVWFIWFTVSPISRALVLG